MISRGEPTEVVAIAVAPTVTNYDATTYKDFPTDLRDVAVGGNLEQVYSSHSSRSQHSAVNCIIIIPLPVLPACIL